MKTLLVMLLILGLSVPAFAAEWEKVEHQVYRKPTYKGWAVSVSGNTIYVPDENHEWRLG